MSRCWIAVAVALAACSSPLPAGQEPDLSADNADLAVDHDLATCHNDCPSEGAGQCTADGKRELCQKDGACLMWGPAADCDAGSLCCSGSCVPADEQNCFACGTVCGGATPVCSATLARCACTPASCAPSQHDCDPGLGICVSCESPPVPESRTDFYVDGRATASPTGSLGCPYATISDALAPAGSSSGAFRIIHVAAGTYSNETFPMVVRSGVAIVGESAASTIIQGEGALDHSTVGGALNFANLFASILIGDPTNTNTLANLTVRPPAASPLPGHYGVLCDQGNAPQTITNPPSPSPTPNSVLEGVTIGPGYDYGVAVTNSTIPAATGGDLHLLGSTVHGNNNGMWVVGCGTGGPGGIVSAQVGDGTAMGGNQFLGNSNGANGGYGLIVWDCSSPVAVSYNTFDGDDAGMALAQHPRLDVNIPVPGYITVENNVFRNLTHFGIDMGAAVIVERMLNNTFNNISTAAVILENSSGGASNYRPQIKRARGNQFVGNDVAVLFRGTVPIAPDPGALDTDFGTTADPGNNLFRCNSSTTATGYDLQVASTAANGGSLRFAGNQWDHAPPSAANAASGANGTDVIITAPSSPPTMILDNPTLSTATCPAGRTP